MILLRSLVYFATMTITVVMFASLIAVFGGVLGPAFSDRWASRWGRLNLWLQRVICGLGYEIEGLENLPDKACIIMSKHQSTWETISLRAILPPRQSWVLKQELMQIPLFGLGLKFVKSIPIDRSAGRRAVLQVIEEGRQRLEDDRYVIVFPEGTRTAPGQHKKYGIGGALLAERTGVDVIPISHNAGVFWRRRGVKKYPGTIRVVVGPPIPSAGRKAADIIRDVETWIEAQQKKLPMQRDKT